MNISNLNETIEYSGSEIGKSLLKFIKDNCINDLHMNSVINFSSKLRKEEHLPLSGKYKLIGSDPSTNNLLIFKKESEKNKIYIDFNVFNKLNKKGYLKFFNE